MSKVENYIPMFAYGILKYPVNILNEGGINIVEGAHVKRMRLYCQGGVGIALANDMFAEMDDKVVGTYFEITESVVLNEYDYVEGFTVGGVKANNMYNREVVDVTLPNGEVKKANMYIANILWFYGDFKDEHYIPSGVIEDKWLLRLKIDANKEEVGE